jgi:hypothetical protein
VDSINYEAIAKDLGISTGSSSSYKDIVDTLLSIGGFDSIKNVSIENGSAYLDYNRRTGEYAITPSGPQESMKAVAPWSSYEYTMSYKINEKMVAVENLVAIASLRYPWMIPARVIPITSIIINYRIYNSIALVETNKRSDGFICFFKYYCCYGIVHRISCFYDPEKV